MKKNLSKVIVTLLISTIVLSACGNSKNKTTDVAVTTTTKEATANEKVGEVIVDFWTAPQVVQFKYWSEIADKFNAANILQDGKKIVVKVQQMPEAPSSEAGIQNALATDTAPAISENINRGFAATLAASDAIYNLEDEQWFKDIISVRKMEESIPSWAIADKQYVLPVYVNPMAYQWNMVGLRALGVKTPPTTVDELKNVIELYRAQKGTTMKDSGVMATFYRPSFNRPDQWWDAWFDFQMQYACFNGGDGSWVDGDTLVLKKDVAKKTLEFFGLLGDSMMMSELSTLWTADQVPFLFSVSAPWEIEMMKESGKVYGLEGDYIYSPAIVQNKGDKFGSFGDSKGIVLYKDANISEETHNAAVTYISWVYNKENASATDLGWLKATKMLPVRGDLLEETTIKAYLDESAELQALASYINNTFPAMAHAKMPEIQGAFVEYGLSPYMNEAVKLKDFNVPDASTYIEKAFIEMKTVGSLN